MASSVGRKCTIIVSETRPDHARHAAPAAARGLRERSSVLAVLRMLLVVGLQPHGMREQLVQRVPPLEGLRWMNRLVVGHARNLRTRAHFIRLATRARAASRLPDAKLVRAAAEVARIDLVRCPDPRLCAYPISRSVDTSSAGAKNPRRARRLSSRAALTASSASRPTSPSVSRGTA